MERKQLQDRGTGGGYSTLSIYLFILKKIFCFNNANNMQNRIRFYVRTYYLYYKHLTARDEYLPIQSSAFMHIVILKILT